MALAARQLVRVTTQESLAEPDLLQHRDGAVPGVGWPTAQHLVEQRAQGIHIAAGIDLVNLAQRLLGWHVGGRARHLPHLRLVGAVAAAVGLHRVELAVVGRPVGPAQHLGQAPVEHQHLAVAAHHDVVGLEIAMHDTGLVRRLENRHGPDSEEHDSEGGDHRHRGDRPCRRKDRRCRGA